jgi:hypothetical protein
MRRLPGAVKRGLEKGRDSALLAVEVYNKPAVKFKSGCYISLMVIAWTSLFHAIFFRRKVKPFRRKPNGRFERIDGDYKYWELEECLRHYYGSDTGNPVRKNLEFFIPLRNQIEHRSMPELDSSIFGECQAMLLNFDAMLEKEFGLEFCIRESLSFSLQLFPSAENLAQAVKQNPSTKPVVDFVRQYRSSISTEVLASGKFSFKAFLIQVANHQSENVLPIQFVNYDKLSEEEKQKVSRIAALIKLKEVPVSNADTMKPSEVVRKVQAGLGNPKMLRGKKEVNRFNEVIHAKCWRKFNVRPSSGSAQPNATNPKYCVYDKAHGDYVYTQTWVDFLIEQLRDEAVFSSMYKATSPGPSPGELGTRL